MPKTALAILFQIEQWLEYVMLSSGSLCSGVYATLLSFPLESITKSSEGRSSKSLIVTVGVFLMTPVIPKQANLYILASFDVCLQRFELPYQMRMLSLV